MVLSHISHPYKLNKVVLHFFTSRLYSKFAQINHYNLLSMKSRILCIALMFSFVALLSAQDVVLTSPNYDTLKKETYDVNHDHYYPVLMARYMANDTTLTTKEYHTLYYGFSLQEDYNPYRESQSKKPASIILSSDSLSVEACDDLLRYSLLAVKDVPFDLRTINMVIYGYACAGDKDESLVWSKKLQGLMKAILASGSGESQDSPIHIIYPSDEYVVINMLGLKVADSKLVAPNIDYVEVEENKFEKQGYFFDVARLMKVYNNKYNVEQ